MPLISALLLATSIEAAVAAGYGREMSGSHLPSARAGVGLRGGVMLDRVYLGVQMTRHFGSSAGDPESRYEAHYSATHLDAEAAYGVRLWGVSFRPYVGLGLLIARGETTVSGVVASDNRTYPCGLGGLLIAYDVRKAFVGVDLRAVVVWPERFNRTTLGAFAVFGVRF